MYIGDWMARGATYWPERLAVVDDAKGAAGRLSYGQLNRRADRLRDPAPAQPVQTDAVREEDTLCLLLTGGTTGAPKAARISYRMVAWNTLTSLVHELRRDDVTVIHTPLFHTGGLLVYALPLLTVGG